MPGAVRPCWERTNEWSVVGMRSVVRRSVAWVAVLSLPVFGLVAGCEAERPSPSPSPSLVVVPSSSPEVCEGSDAEPEGLREACAEVLTYTWRVSGSRREAAADAVALCARLERPEEAWRFDESLRAACVEVNSYTLG